jgi:alkyl hydroperoxide reductase subunit AhpC
MKIRIISLVLFLSTFYTLHFSHLAWLNTPKSKGGIEGVKYPIVSDITKSILQIMMFWLKVKG